MIHREAVAESCKVAVKHALHECVLIDFADIVFGHVFINFKQLCERREILVCLVKLCVVMVLCGACGENISYDNGDGA